MTVKNEPDFPITDASCKEHTGKTLVEWYAELDSSVGADQGRRALGKYLQDAKINAWWLATINIEYERTKGIVKKNGDFEGYTICVTKGINAPVPKVFSTWHEKFSSLFQDSPIVNEEGFSCQKGCKATFTRVRPDKDLRFTWEHEGCAAPMTVDVQFQDNKGKTLMNVMTSGIQTRGEADGLRAAWAEFLNGLKASSEA